MASWRALNPGSTVECRASRRAYHKRKIAPGPDPQLAVMVTWAPADYHPRILTARPRTRRCGGESSGNAGGAATAAVQRPAVSGAGMPRGRRTAACDHRARPAGDALYQAAGRCPRWQPGLQAAPGAPGLGADATRSPAGRDAEPARNRGSADQAL